MIYALTTGVNDYGGENNLRYAVGDSIRLSRTLEKFPNKIKLVDNFTDKDATHTNIIKKVKEIASSNYIRPNDKILLTYSGHGAQVSDTSGDEIDGLDEVLCTYGFDWKDNMLRDDDIFDLRLYIPENINFELIFDCCHSGTASRGIERYIRSIRNPNQELQNTTSKYVKSSVTRPKLNSKNSILWSGCKDEEYSYEDYFEDIKDGSGLLTYFFIKALESNEYGIDSRRSSIHSFITKSIKSLKKYPQNPQLDCGFFAKYSKIFS